MFQYLSQLLEGDTLYCDQIKINGFRANYNKFDPTKHGLDQLKREEEYGSIREPLFIQNPQKDNLIPTKKITSPPVGWHMNN